MGGTVALGLLLPFAGTTLGAAMVFFLKREIAPKLQKLLLGFASGVMIAASVWSLILPSVELARESGIIEWLPAAAGFVGECSFCSSSIRSCRISIWIRTNRRGTNPPSERPSCSFFR